LFQQIVWPIIWLEQFHLLHSHKKTQKRAKTGKNIGRKRRHLAGGLISLMKHAGSETGVPAQPPVSNPG
jgi:hypothetical protein